MVNRTKTVAKKQSTEHLLQEAVAAWCWLGQKGYSQAAVVLRDQLERDFGKKQVQQTIDQGITNRREWKLQELEPLTATSTPSRNANDDKTLPRDAAQKNTVQVDVGSDSDSDTSSETTSSSSSDSSSGDSRQQKKGTPKVESRIKESASSSSSEDSSDSESDSSEDGPDVARKILTKRDEPKPTSDDESSTSSSESSSQECSSGSESASSDDDNIDTKNAVKVATSDTLIALRNNELGQRDLTSKPDVAKQILAIGDEAEPTSEDESSSSSSSSDSSSEDSSSSSSDDDSDSSSSSASTSDESPPTKKAKMTLTVVQPLKTEAIVTPDEGSDSDVTDVQVSDVSSVDVSSSDDDSSSSEDGEEEDDNNDDDNDRVHEQQQLKKQQEAAQRAQDAARAALAWKPSSNTTAAKIAVSPGTDGAQALSKGKPFKRVDSEFWGTVASGKGGSMANNSYEGTFGSDGFGAKSSGKLAQVRGKDFRHEKNKRKRSFNGFARTGGQVNVDRTYSTKFSYSEGE